MSEGLLIMPIQTNAIGSRCAEEGVIIATENIEVGDVFFVE